MYINRNRNSAEHMQLLIKDILTFSKISIEKPAFVKSNLNVLVNNVLEQLDETVKTKNLKIVIEKLPTLYVNPTLMQVVFQNLISNAMKYSKKGMAPVIKIKAETNADSNELNGI